MGWGNEMNIWYSSWKNQLLCFMDSMDFLNNYPNIWLTELIMGAYLRTILVITFDKQWATTTQSSYTFSLKRNAIVDKRLVVCLKQSPIRETHYLRFLIH